MADELELAFDFCKDDLVTEEEVDAAYQKAVTAVEALELKNMLRQEADQMDCVLKLIVVLVVLKVRIGLPC